MKLLLPICLISLFLTHNAWANTNYDSVIDWKNCTKKVGTGVYVFPCLPPHRPSNCPAPSWELLTKNNMLPWCPLCPPPKK